MSVTMPFRTGTTASGKLPAGALRAVSHARTATQQQRLDWATHPDERYAIALAHTVWLRDGRAVEQNQIAAVLAVRGIIEARREGHAWNPILDGVGRGPSPVGYDMAQVAGMFGARPGDVTLVPISRMLEPLAAWLDTQSDPECVVQLLKFRATDVLQLVASRAPLDPNLVGALVERDAKLAEAFLANPRLDQASAEALFDWAFQNLTSCEGRRIATYAETIARLDEDRQRPIRPEEISCLIEFAEEESNGDLTSGQPRWRAVDALIRLRRHLNVNDIHRVMAQAAVYGGFIDDLVTAAACDAAAVRDALAWSKSGAIRAYVASVPQWRRDPEIREVLMRSLQVEVLAVLMDDTVEDAEFRKVFRRVLHRRGTFDALSLLEKSPIACARLQPADFEPLLSSSNPDHRLRAIALLSSLRGSS